MSDVDFSELVNREGWPGDLPKFKYAMLLSYSGTNYCGWQLQKGSAASGQPSIQETLNHFLGLMTSQPRVSVVGSGRTDSGVHAAGQVAHFILNREWEVRNLFNGMNSHLPPSIRILAVKRVPIEFHAQRDAQKKQYSFYFQQGPQAMPHLEHFSWWIRRRLDDQAMQQALAALVGEHDFKPFQSSGAEVRTTVRSILEARVTREPVLFPQAMAFAGGVPLEMVRVRVVGTGFLKQMVRGIAGTLLQVGEGRRPATCMAEILEKQARNLVGPTAPGRGLWLEKVWYPELTW